MANRKKARAFLMLLRSAVVVDNAPSISASTFSLVGDSLRLAYTFSSPVSSIEKNIKPTVENVQVTGTLQEGQTISIAATVKNNTGYTVQSATVKIYTATNIQGASEAFSVNASNIVITGNNITANHLLAAGQTSKFILVEVIATLAGGQNAVSDGRRNVQWLGPIASGVSKLDYFTELNNRFAGGSLANEPIGDAADMSNGTNAPTWDAVNGELDFTTNQNLLFTKTGSYAEPYTLAIRFKKNGNTGTQNILSLSGTVFLRTSGTNLQWKTGTIKAAIDTNYHWYFLVLNGAASKLYFDGDAAITFDSGGTDGGSGSGRVGCTTAGASFAELSIAGGGKNGIFSVRGVALTPTQIDEIRTELGLI